MNATLETTTATTGHDEECICPTCMMADMTAHIRKTRSVDDAERLLTELGAIAEKVKGERTRFAKPGQRAGRGVVRKISDKQARYLAFLLKSRDFTSLMVKPWFTTDVANISLAGARTLIDALLGCPERPADEIAVDMITPGQKSFIMSLITTKEIAGTVFVGKTESDVDRLTKAGASKAIAQLKELPYPERKALTVENVKAIAGIYELSGEIYRMKKAKGKSHFYAMILDRDAGDAWNYAEGMSRKVPAEGRKLSLDECEALSLRVGGCVMCGQNLTATVDGVGPAARFVGPICAGKMGF